MKSKHLQSKITLTELESISKGKKKIENWIEQKRKKSGGREEEGTWSGLKSGLITSGSGRETRRPRRITVHDCDLKED